MRHLGSFSSLHTILSLTLILCTACFQRGGPSADDVATGDADADGDVDADVDADVDTDVDADTDTDLPPLDLTEPLGAEFARVGQIVDEAALLPGPLVQGRAGDYKLYNNQLAVVIEGLRDSDGWGVYGGTVTDASPVRLDGSLGESLFTEYFFGYNLRLQDPDSIEVVNDGRDGEPAILRFTGLDASLPFLDSLLGDVLPSEPLNETLTVEYILAPDSNVLEIRTTINNTGSEILDLSLAFHAFFLGDGLRYYYPGQGFGKGGVGTGGDLVVAAGPEVSYGFFLPDDDNLTVIFQYEGMVFCKSGGQRVRQGTTKTFSSFFAVTGGGVNPVQSAHRAWLGDTDVGFISGTVKDANGAPMPHARVNVLFGAEPEYEDHVSQVPADENGYYELEMIPATYRLVAYDDGHPVGDPVVIVLESRQQLIQDLNLPQPATVGYTIRDATGRHLPAKLTFQRDGGRDAPPDSFGEVLAPSGYQWIERSAAGAGELELPPGTYTVTASRGHEYEIDAQDFTVEAGKRVDLEFSIARTVDTSGYISIDGHIHSMSSPDSDVPWDDRVTSAAVEGVEAPISTDHDIIADWSSVVKPLGLEDWINPIVGSEITTYTYGHFNAWPLISDPTQLNYGAFSWYDKWAPELFAEVAAYSTEPIMVINHPRSPAISGYFSAVGYDRDTMTFGREDNWSAQFDCIEIFNGRGTSTPLNETLPDWYAFLNHGYRFCGASGSDSHTLSNEVGGVRSYIASSTDLPAERDEFELRDNMRALDVIVSTGPFVRAAVDGAGPGQDVTWSTGAVPLEIEVQAPTWMDVHTLEIVANGEQIASRELDASTADPDDPVVRFRGGLELPAEVDTWYVVIARGSRSMSPVVRGATPFAFTNPIFVDVDGDGGFTALHE